MKDRCAVCGTELQYPKNYCIIGSGPLLDFNCKIVCNKHANLNAEDNKRTITDPNEEHAIEVAKQLKEKLGQPKNK
jgi:hypothetical protein